jgi:hypothetical protein
MYAILLEYLAKIACNFKQEVTVFILNVKLTVVLDSIRSTS